MEKIDIVREDIFNWESLTNKLTEQFLYDYFDDVDPDYWWVSNDVGGVFNYGDYKTKQNSETR